MLNGVGILLDDAGYLSAGLHAWTTGAIGLMTLAMMTRATRSDISQTYDAAAAARRPKGIGREAVRCLANAGYNVEFTCRSSTDAGAELIGELKVDFPEQEFRLHVLDLADRSAVDDLATKLSRAEALYGFVHNAGASYDSLAATIDQDRELALMQVNFWSMIRFAAASAIVSRSATSCFNCASIRPACS